MDNQPVVNPKPTAPAFPDLAALPQIFQSALPPSVPQLQYRLGVFTIFENWIHNWKLVQMERASSREANIAENHTRKIRAQFEGIKELLLFGQNYERELKTIRHEIKMMDLTEEISQSQLINLQLKNMQEQVELQIAQLDLKFRLREAKENGLVETEDNDG